MKQGSWRRERKYNEVKWASLGWDKPEEPIDANIDESSLHRRTSLSHQGRRGKRLAGADARMAKAANEEPCICGCNSTEISWSHLESRRYEATRHAEWNWLPTDPMLTMWLDQHPEGVHAKRHLKELARLKGERLTTEEAHEILAQFGWYEYMTRGAV